MSKTQAEAERRTAIEDHATYGQGNAPGPTLAQQLTSLEAALAGNLSKPVHKQSETVIADLRTKIKHAKTNIALHEAGKLDCYGRAFA